MDEYKRLSWDGKYSYYEYDDQNIHFIFGKCAELEKYIIHEFDNFKGNIESFIQKYLKEWKTLIWETESTWMQSCLMWYSIYKWSYLIFIDSRKNMPAWIEISEHFVWSIDSELRKMIELTDEHDILLFII